MLTLDEIKKDIGIIQASSDPSFDSLLYKIQYYDCGYYLLFDGETPYQAPFNSRSNVPVCHLFTDQELADSYITTHPSRGGQGFGLRLRGSFGTCSSDFVILTVSG